MSEHAIFQLNCHFLMKPISYTSMLITYIMSYSITAMMRPYDVHGGRRYHYHNVTCVNCLESDAMCVILKHYMYNGRF